MLLMARRVPLVVLILKDFTLYSVSQEKELSNDTQQAPLGTFAQSAKILTVWAYLEPFGAGRVKVAT